jgi:hypothetical protein
MWPVLLINYNRKAKFQFAEYFTIVIYTCVKAKVKAKVMLLEA